MKKLKTCLLVAAMAALFISPVTCLADIAGSNDLAIVQLTPDQIAKIDNSIQSIVPLIPGKYQGAVASFIAVLGLLAMAGRILVGWKNNGFFGALSGLFGGTNSPSSPPAVSQSPRASGGTMRCLFWLLIPATAGLLLTGCTLDHPSGKILSVTSRGLYLTVAATDSTTGTPKITFGLGSQTVTMLPTDTNKVYAADFSDSSIIAQTVNPFSTSGSEVLASGDYQVNQGTNSASQPIVPK